MTRRRHPHQGPDRQRQGGAGTAVRNGGSRSGSRRPTARVLLDCGGSGAFLQNARRLREPIETADAFVLSHGHFDHGGGVRELVDAAPSARLVLHPGALVPRWSLRKNGKVDPIGLPDRSLAALRAVAGALDLGCGAA